VSLAQACYAGMFKDCTSLELPPELPSTILPKINSEFSYCDCYSYMFKGCTGLKQIPYLPAISL